MERISWVSFHSQLLQRSSCQNYSHSCVFHTILPVPFFYKSLFGELIGQMYEGKNQCSALVDIQPLYPKPAALLTPCKTEKKSIKQDSWSSNIWGKSQENTISTGAWGPKRATGMSLACRSLYNDRGQQGREQLYTQKWLCIPSWGYF